MKRSTLRSRVPLLTLLVTFIFVIGGGLRGWAASGVHVVRPGENLSTIARDNGTSVEKLVILNDLDSPNRIRIGQRLVVTASPQVHIVKPGETLSGIAGAYGLKPSQLAAWNGVANANHIVPGQELVVSARAIQHRVKRGESAIVIARRYGVTVKSLAVVNHLSDPDRLRAGQTLLIPPTGGGAAEALASAGPLLYRRELERWPLKGTITSDFGPRNGRSHEGVDIAAPHGTAVRAVAPGKVAYADWAGSYGLLLKIDHGSGVETRYGHNSRITVRPGESVRAGQVIARVGSTGRSTGPHLHFELRVNGEAFDPKFWLP